MGLKKWCNKLFNTAAAKNTLLLARPGARRETTFSDAIAGGLVIYKLIDLVNLGANSVKRAEFSPLFGIFSSFPYP